MSNTWPVLVRDTQATRATRLSETPLLLLGTEKHNASVGQKTRPVPKRCITHKREWSNNSNLFTPPSGQSPLRTQEIMHPPQGANLTAQRARRDPARNSTSAPSRWGPRVFPHVHSPQRLRQGKKWPPEVCAPKFLTDLLPTVTSCHWSLSFSIASSPCCFHLGYEH